MKRDVRLYLDDILECVEKIQEYTKGINEEQFARNTLMQDAVLRRLEIIGEAVKHIPKQMRDRHPEIPWQDVAGTRDILIQKYFGVRLQNAWKIVQEDLDALKANVNKMIEDLS
ncbi:MAG: DUF86 domain-containing protein [Chloroflexi bacterium]|nr:DUF86 domain-containing protein [Chloroflexota bacterium]